MEVEQLRPQLETARARQMAVRAPNRRFRAGTGSLGGRGEPQEDSKQRNLPTNYSKRASQMDTNLRSQKYNHQGAVGKIVRRPVFSSLLYCLMLSVVSLTFASENCRQ